VVPDRSFLEVTMRTSHRLLAVPTLALIPLLALAADKGADKGKMPESDPFGRYTVDQVERRLGKPSVYVFDANDAETYAKNHVPGAVRVNHKDIPENVLPADKDATLIFYCANEL
jgi:Rhodanese-like domain